MNRWTCTQWQACWSCTCVKCQRRYLPMLCIQRSWKLSRRATYLEMLRCVAFTRVYQPSTRQLLISCWHIWFAWTNMRRRTRCHCTIWRQCLDRHCYDPVQIRVAIPRVATHLLPVLLTWWHRLAFFTASCSCICNRTINRSSRPSPILNPHDPAPFDSTRDRESAAQTRRSLFRRQMRRLHGFVWRAILLKRFHWDWLGLRYVLCIIIIKLNDR